MGSSRRCLLGSLEADALSGTGLCAYLSVFPSADRVSLPLLAAAELLCVSAFIALTRKSLRGLAVSICWKPERSHLMMAFHETEGEVRLECNYVVCLGHSGDIQESWPAVSGGNGMNLIKCQGLFSLSLRLSLGKEKTRGFIESA